MLNGVWMFVCSPNESGAPRGLGRLKDTSIWEKRKIKGKVAIQRMVVDLMEVYLNRLRLRRPPYPKNPAMAEFASQFPYEPTPDQKQVFYCLILSHFGSRMQCYSMFRFNKLTV